MAGWNGAGTFSREFNWVSDAAAGIDITASRMDGDSDTFAGGINLCLTKDGQNSPTANLPMAAFKHTNVANGSARTDYAAVGQVQDGSFIWGGTAGGTGDAMTIAPSPAITAYAAGQTFRFITVGANTLTNPTINVSLVGTKTITRQGATALVAGDMPSGAVVEVVYDGTEFQLVNVKKIAVADLPATVALLDAANNFTANQTITSTDAGAGAGPIVTLDRNSASPAASDLLGEILLRMRSSTGVTRDAVALVASILDATNASEDANLLIKTIVAGTLTDILTLGPGAQIGAPTGGDKGAGTVNIQTGLYVGGVLINSLGVAKVKVSCDSSGAILGTALNCTVARTGNGAYTITFTSAFADVNWVGSITAVGGTLGASIATIAAGSATVRTYVPNTGVMTDEAFHFLAFA